MNKILQDFTNEMEFLKKYMKLQKKSYSDYFKSSSVPEDLKSLPIAKIKQFNFNSYIISIYGAYENFIEQMLSEYLKKLCTIVSNFSQLPEEKQKNNQKNFEIFKYDGMRAQRMGRADYAIKCFTEALALFGFVLAFIISG